MWQRSIVSTQLILLYQASCRRPQKTGQPVASVMTLVLQAKRPGLFLGPGDEWCLSEVSRREWLRGVGVGRQAIAVGRGSAK